ncbi:MAG: serpin family protein [Bacteroidota bacterium]
MKTLLSYVLIFFLTTNLLGCSEQRFDTVEHDKISGKVSNSQVNKKNATFIKSMNMFAFDLLEEISTEQSDENIFFSPVSIYSALGLVYAGAHGATRNEVEKALHLEKTGDNIHDELSLFFNELNQAGNNNSSINITNTLIIQDGFDILPSFKNLAQDKYNAQILSTDFIGAPDIALDDINESIANHSKQVFPEILKKNDINKLTRFVIGNTINFEASWEDKFNPQYTSKDVFYGVGNRQDSIEYMHQTNAYNYYEDNKTQIVELPYINNHSMLIVLPKPDNNTDNSKHYLDYSMYDTLLNKINNQRVKLYMPKMLLKTEYNLENYLKKLGIKLVFKSTSGFSRIFKENLMPPIERIKHASYIKLDENKTEATSSTIMSLLVSSYSDSSQPKLMKVNHPFYFFIKDDKTNNILFLGHIKHLTP